MLNEVTAEERKKDYEHSAELSDAEVVPTKTKKAKEELNLTKEDLELIKEMTSMFREQKTREKFIAKSSSET